MTGGAGVTAEAPVHCVCGRLLTDDVSRRRGLGPRCYRRLYGAHRAPSPQTHHNGRSTGHPRQLALYECEPVWDEDDWFDGLDREPRYPDLRGQGLTYIQLHTMQTIHLTGSYL